MAKTHFALYFAHHPHTFYPALNDRYEFSARRHPTCLIFFLAGCPLPLCHLLLGTPPTCFFHRGVLSDAMPSAPRHPTNLLFFLVGCPHISLAGSAGTPHTCFSACWMLPSALPSDSRHPTGLFFASRGALCRYAVCSSAPLQLVFLPRGVPAHLPRRLRRHPTHLFFRMLDASLGLAIRFSAPYRPLFRLAGCPLPLRCLLFGTPPTCFSSLQGACPSPLPAPPAPHTLAFRACWMPPLASPATPRHPTHLLSLLVGCHLGLCLRPAALRARFTANGTPARQTKPYSPLPGSYP